MYWEGTVDMKTKVALMPALRARFEDRMLDNSMRVKIKKYLEVCSCLLVVSGIIHSPSGHAALVDFESLADGELVTSQVAGMSFTNTIALQAGIGLNEFEFPPKSGSVVVSDLSGPITISFGGTINQFDAYFTYSVPLTLTAFDTGGTPIDAASSLFSSNLVLSGDSGSAANELITLSSSLGIASVVIAGLSEGGSFTLDDLVTTPVPVPASYLLLLGGLASLITRCRSRLPQ
jgi:hypothetical protein